jgi:hypothetical protein
MEKTLNTWNLGENPQDLFITEVNFNLCPSDREFLLLRLERLQNLAPAFSTFHLWLKKKGRFFFAHLQVYAYQKTFQTQLHKNSIKELTLALEEEMTQQFHNWKVKRFKPQNETRSL